MTVPADKAKQIYDNWKNPPGDLTDEQYEMLQCIEKIYFNNHSLPEPDTSNLTHTGITQGMTQALPVNDR